MPELSLRALGLLGALLLLGDCRPVRPDEGGRVPGRLSAQPWEIFTPDVPAASRRDVIPPGLFPGFGGPQYWSIPFEMRLAVERLEREERWRKARQAQNRKKDGWAAEEIQEFEALGAMDGPGGTGPGSSP